VRRAYEDKDMSTTPPRPRQPAPAGPVVDPRPSEREAHEEATEPRPSEAELAEERAEAMEEAEEDEEGGETPA
jgi:hypothetical protein